MAQVKCPICGVMFEVTAAMVTAPFCSARCKQIDLGRWLGERYSVPVKREEDEDETGESDEELKG